MQTLTPATTFRVAFSDWTPCYKMYNGYHVTKFSLRQHCQRMLLQRETTGSSLPTCRAVYVRFGMK